MISLDQWYQTNKGQSLLVGTTDKSLRGQCFIMFDSVLHDVYGLPYLNAPGAINIWENNGSYGLKPYFDFIPYAPQMPMKKADIVIYGTGVGSPFGHVDVAAQDGIGSNYLGYDSNWAHNLTVHAQPHNDSYNQYIFGILRFKGTPQEEPMFNDGDAVNFNTYFFGKDNGLFRDQVGRDWKTAAYNIMEYMNSNKNLIFNDGDAVNINNALYGKDENRFKSSVGVSWKQAIYNILQDQSFQTDALINQGDVPALNQVTGRTDGDTQVGKTWKDCFEYYLSPNTKSNYAQVGMIDNQPIYRKV